MKDLILEIIQEACEGKVMVDNLDWPFSFNTIINGKRKYINKNNNITLHIRDIEEFKEKIKEYINLELDCKRSTMKIYNGNVSDKIKWYIVNLFANMTTEDFLNPIAFIDKYMAFLRDKTFDYLDEGITVKLPKVKDSELEIKREQNNTSMETPNRITLTLKKKREEFTTFKLPSIYYAVREENNKKVCYIYSVMNKDNKKLNESELKFQKQINRLLYKLNDGVVDSEEYYEYKEALKRKEEKEAQGEEVTEEIYYPEGNISDITNSFLFSLNIFMSLLQKEGIETVKVVTYLPVRYNSRAIAAEESPKKKEFQERNDMIQTNATNKLIRTFRRLAHQNDALEITMYPYEYDEFLTISLRSRDKELDNMLLEESNDIINSEVKEK
ncbi:MAG: hypothetical protein IJ463_08475 [Bacilli bacterium]|nr:hypothetical protein [Bacilli bacterium]